MRLTTLYSRLEREFRHLNKRDLLPIDSFWHKIDNSLKILRIVEDHSKDISENHKEKLILNKEARKNFVINCITAVEVYFKDIVKALPEVNTRIKYSDGLKDLLKNKEKTNLWEAYEIFKEKEFRLGDILVYYYSFQNLNEINHVISKLLSVNFLDKINMHPTKLEDWEINFFGKRKILLDKDYPNWRKYTNEIFKLRHDYVHHIDYKDKLGFERVGSLFFNLCAFVTVSDSYILEFVPEG